MRPDCSRRDPAEADLADLAIHDGGQNCIAALEVDVPAHMAVEAKIVLRLIDIRASNGLPVTAWLCHSAEFASPSCQLQPGLQMIGAGFWLLLAILDH